MKNLARPLQIATVLLSIFAGSASFAGGMTSSGGDWIIDEVNPWFVGTRPVEWCVMPVGDFSRSASSSAAIIQTSLNEWAYTIDHLSPKPTIFKLPDGQIKNLSTKFVFSANCTDQTELVFKLGFVDDQVKEALKQRAANVYSAAVRTQLDDKSGRAKGFIWMVADRGPNQFKLAGRADFWSDDLAMSIVLQHELGHVFGFPHELKGVMSPDVSIEAIQGNLGPFIKLQARDYVDYIWLYNSKTVCGNAIVSRSTEAIGIATNGPKWLPCIKAEKVADRQYKITFTFLDLITKDGVRPPLTLTMMDLTSGYATYHGISGVFSELGGATEEPRGHTFIYFVDGNYEGSGKDSDGKVVNVAFHQDEGNYFDITIIKDGKMASYRFVGKDASHFE